MKINTKHKMYKLPMISKIKNRDTALVAIARRGFVVGSIDQNGSLSVSANPVVHDKLTDASDEAKRLATQTPGKIYVPLQISGGFESVGVRSL